MTDEKLHDLMVDIRDADLERDQSDVPYSPVPRGLSNKRRGRRISLPLVAVGSALFLSLMGGAGFWLYSIGVETGKSRVPPLIRASLDPEKIKPDEPGGDQIPHQDKQLFEMIEKAAEDTPAEPATDDLSLNDGLEKPISRPLESETVPPSTIKDMPPVNPAPAGEVAALPLEQAEKENNDAAEIANAIALMEKTPEDLMKFVEQIEDGNVPPVAEAEMPTAVAPGDDPAAGEQKTSSEKETEIAVEPEVKTIVVEADPSEPAETATEEETVIVSSAGSVTPGGPWLVQLASFKSKADADKAWEQLSLKHKLIMAGTALDVQQALIKDKGTWYRLRADGFNTKGDALRFCNQLKEKKQDCLVVSR